MNLPARIVWALCILTGTLIAPAGAAEPRVEVRGGNIFLHAGGSAAKQLTASGRDSAPVLSPDGRYVVFVRALPGKRIDTGSGDVAAEELWQVDAGGKEPVRLVAPHEAEDVRNIVANFQDVQFSLDGRLVYFVTDAYATSGAVHVVDTTNGKERFFLAGSTVEVVRHGEYRDCLLIEQHRYFIGGGSYDWVWLFRPDGQEVGPVGEDVSGFKAMYYPDGQKGRKQP